MHTVSYEFSVKPEESAECHQTISSRVVSGHETTSSNTMTTSLASQAILANQATIQQHLQPANLHPATYHPMKLHPVIRWLHIHCPPLSSRDIVWPFVGERNVMIIYYFQSVLWTLIVTVDGGVSFTKLHEYHKWQVLWWSPGYKANASSFYTNMIFYWTDLQSWNSWEMDAICLLWREHCDVNKSWFLVLLLFLFCIAIVFECTIVPSISMSM